MPAFTHYPNHVRPKFWWARVYAPGPVTATHHAHAHHA